MSEPITMSRACPVHCLGTKGKDLLAACKLAKQLLDALRLESGIGNYLTDPEKETFRFVDETLQKSIEGVENEKRKLWHMCNTCLAQGVIRPATITKVTRKGIRHICSSHSKKKTRGKG